MLWTELCKQREISFSPRFNGALAEHLRLRGDQITVGGSFPDLKATVPPNDLDLEVGNPGLLMASMAGWDLSFEERPFPFDMYPAGSGVASHCGRFRITGGPMKVDVVGPRMPVIINRPTAQLSCNRGGIVADIDPGEQLWRINEKISEKEPWRALGLIFYLNRKHFEQRHRFENWESGMASLIFAATKAIASGYRFASLDFPYQLNQLRKCAELF